MGEPAPLIETTKERQQLMKQAALEAAINNKVYTPRDILNMASGCAAYIEDCQKNNKPMTVAGFILASGVPAATWYEMRDGKKDSVVTLYMMKYNYTDDDGTPLYIDEDTGEAQQLVLPSDVVKNCYLVLQNQLEANCYNVKAHNVAGSIFGLKAQYGWRDDTQPQKLTQNLVICDAEQAKKALRLLED